MVSRVDFIVSSVLPSSSWWCHAYHSRSVRDSSALTFGMRQFYIVSSFYHSLIPIEASPSPVELWEGPINSLGQLVLILMANMYLASRSVNLGRLVHTE